MGGRRKVEYEVGVISDTHGLVRPDALEALRGVDLILHAGDVGKPEVLSELSEVAPVRAVRGNVDRGEWADALPVEEVVAVGGAKILLVHDLKTLSRSPAQVGAAVVVSGHSHKPHLERRDDILYLNPGSAGPRRFRLPIALAHLHVRGHAIDADIVELP